MVPMAVKMIMTTKPSMKTLKAILVIGSVTIVIIRKVLLMVMMAVMRILVTTIATIRMLTGARERRRRW